MRGSYSEHEPPNRKPATKVQQGPPHPPNDASRYVWPSDEELAQLYADVTGEDHALASAGLTEYALGLTRMEEDDEHSATP